VGARLFAPGKKAKAISWLVRTGDDVPDDVKKQIEKWAINSAFEKVVDSLSPRAVVKYKRCPM
jgi:hypothetical protein